MEENDFHGFLKSLDKKLKYITSSGRRTAPREAKNITEQMEQDL